MTPKRSERKSTTLQQFLAGMKVGDTIGHANLSLAPLGGPRQGNLDYIIAADAIAAGTLRITEVSEAGSVPELLATNLAQKPVLLLEGEGLIGAKQNRILNTTILLVASSKTRIPVSCVEQGRWSMSKPNFDVGPHTPSSIRADNIHEVSFCVRTKGEARSDQAAVWHNVQAQTAALGVPSPTMAMHDVYEQRRESFDAYVKALPYPAGARGVIVAINGRFVAMDMFDQALTLERLWPRLITGYAVDAVCQKQKDSVKAFTSKGAAALLEHVAEIECQPCPSVGLGQDWRYEAVDVLGHALEAQIFINLDDDGKYRMQGYIDRLSQRFDGIYEIHDYKTSRHLPTQAEADHDRQLALYQLGVQGMWKDAANVELIWHYLRYDKEIRSRRTPKQLQTVRESCIATIDDIEARGKDESRFPTNPTHLCDWCEYRALCPATRHFVAVEVLPPKKFKTDEGVGLVDSWVAIRKKRQQLQDQDAALASEEETVQGQIIEFARQQKLEAVTGSSHSAKIVQKTGIEYPGPGSEDRQAFEKALKKTGLWDQLVSLHWAKLKSLWTDEEALPDSSRKALKPFIRETEETQVKLKKGGVEE